MSAAPTLVKNGFLDIPAYLTVPDEAEAAPGVLLLTEWAGLNEHMRDLARRFAAAGLACLVHEPFVRDAGPQPATTDDLGARMLRLADEDALSDIAAAANWLRSQPGVDGRRIGVAGFCMGGRLALLAAARVQALGAAVCFYGSPNNWGDGTTPKRPYTPGDLASQIACPVLGIYGAEDPFIPVPEVRKLEAALRAVRRSATITIYPEAGHAFVNDTAAGYHPAAAQQAWDQMIAFCRQHLA